MNKIKSFFQRQVTRIRKNTFVKSVLTLSAGVVVSQAVALCTTPVISRIYTPEVLGDFSLITSNATIIGVIVCLGLISAIMIPKDNDEAKGLCRLLTFLIIGLTTILLCVALAFSPVLQLFTVSLDYRLACCILWLYVILTNISSVCYSYVNRQGLYRVLFWNPTIGTVSNAAISIILGLLGCGLWGYICGNLLALILNILHMLFHVNPFKGKIAADYRHRTLIKKYKEFPLILFPSNLVGTFAQQMPVQLIGRFWGSTVLGSYSMCMTILGLPSKFLAGPVNRVFYKEATERYNNGENIGVFTLKILKANIKIAIIPIALLIVLGGPIFSFILGSDWEMAGTFASVMGIYQVMVFCNSCLAGKFVVINKKKTILFLNIAGVVFYFAVFMVCHLLSFTPLTSITVFAISGALFELTDTFIFMKQSRVNLKDYFYFLILYLIIPAVAATGIRLLLEGAVL